MLIEQKSETPIVLPTGNERILLVDDDLSLLKLGKQNSLPASEKCWMRPKAQRKINFNPLAADEGLISPLGATKIFRLIPRCFQRGSSLFMVFSDGNLHSNKSLAEPAYVTNGG